MKEKKENRVHSNKAKKTEFNSMGKYYIPLTVKNIRNKSFAFKKVELKFQITIIQELEAGGSLEDS